MNTKKALRKALVASAPSGPSDWSNGPVALNLRSRDFMAGRKLYHIPKRNNPISFSGGAPSLLPSLPSLMLRGRSSSQEHQSSPNSRHHKHHRHSKRSGDSARKKGEREGLSLRARAQREVQAMLMLRRQVLALTNALVVLVVVRMVGSSCS